MQRWILALVCLSVFGCGSAEEVDSSKPLSISELSQLQGLASAVNQTLASTWGSEFVARSEQRKISSEVGSATQHCQRPVEKDGDKFTRKVTGSCAFRGAVTFSGATQFDETVDGKIDVVDSRIRIRLGIESITIEGTRSSTRHSQYSRLKLNVTMTNGQSVVLSTTYDGYTGSDEYTRYTFETEHGGRRVKASHKEGDRYGYINTKEFEEQDFGKYVPVLR